ncbi:Hcp family type VI secretion system effector [Lampropedia aestuarii]|uniref:Hcp family type VI secretion system effector n=1 Tax=Lampropedia aestuarii TaxID=2562762 RepID=UPI0024694AB8|nr:type VI secretion system tube protein Hcp [Lampropedia aestuarii]MDH5858724.1 type VI secretion system tube protein Hcp [Lampropedia aestuarii]
MASLQDFFIKIDGISGESKDSKHAGWIDVLSFSYGVSQSSSSFTGGGAGVGKANFDALVFEHYADKATPNLMQYCASGKHIGEVKLEAAKVGDGSQVYFIITLTDAIITHAGPSGSTDDARVKETVGISYSKIKVEVKEQNANGSLGAATTGGWDVKQNVQA